MSARRTHAFTLIELLVVVAIIGILAALLFPVFGATRAKAQRVKCLSNLRQISVAGTLLLLNSRERMPNRSPKGNYGQAAAQLLPYLGPDLRIFRCPSNRDAFESTSGGVVTQIEGHPGEFTNYEFNQYMSTPTGCTPARPQSGLENLAEAAFVYDLPWSPLQNLGDLWHKTGVNIAFMDGHAAFVLEKDLNYPRTSGPLAFYEKGMTDEYRGWCN